LRDSAVVDTGALSMSVQHASVWSRMTYTVAGRRAALIVGTLLIITGRSASILDKLLLGILAPAELVLAADAAEVHVFALQGGQQ
jgi:hypothetical protein